MITVQALFIYYNIKQCRPHIYYADTFLTFEKKNLIQRFNIGFLMSGMFSHVNIPSQYLWIQSLKTVLKVNI